MNLKKEMREYARGIQSIDIDEAVFKAAVERSKEGLLENDAGQYLTWPEFIYEQIYYINKSWWLLQAAVLVLLWVLLKTAVSETYIERCMGILAPMFIILVLPELWKNVSNCALEIEGAALFSLQKVMTARMILFGMIDLILLTVFVTAGITFTSITILEMLVHFLLPMFVTTCICLRMFSGRYWKGILPSIAASLLWLTLWILVVLRDDVYSKVSVPVWIILLMVSIAYICYCVHRILCDSVKYFDYSLEGDR